MNIAIIGASGAIGSALASNYLSNDKLKKLYLYSRSDTTLNHSKIVKNFIDIEDEESIKQASCSIEDGILDILIIATGMLHDEQIKPEKSLKDLTSESFLKLYKVNTIGPALVAKYFFAKMNNKTRSVLAFLSARVGSISDNYLGGWYSYRCSKAALNMLIKNISIEVKRKNDHLIVIGIHPGTVASNLSSLFTNSSHKVFSNNYSASKIIDVIDNIDDSVGGRLVAWDGKIIDC